MAKLSNNIDYRTRLDLYTNCLNEPDHIDILWDNIIAFKFSKALGGSLGVTMVYDHNVPGQLRSDGTASPLGWTQLKQVLNLGFQYKF